jgi:putative Mg2+ transporter-C (MgtC) family protein
MDIYHMSAELGKLMLAALLGGAIGLEREAHGQAAGIRTYTIICVGACLMMILSLHMEELYQHLNVDSVVRLDPARIASYAIASMGFLGAGAIIKGKGSVKGLTTAAGLWLVTGIGLAVGAGHFFPALAGTFISLLVLYGLRRITKKVLPHDIYTMLTLQFSGMNKPLEQIKSILSEYPRISIQFVNFEYDITSHNITYRLRLLSKEIVHLAEITRRLSEIKGIEKISWEEGSVP